MAIFIIYYVGMHTKKLHALHAPTYEAFFTQQKIIFSSPFVLSWTWDADARYSWVAIKQKIPLRMYIGITSEPKPGIHFGNIIYRDMSEWDYVETAMYEYAPYFYELEKYIKHQKTQRDEWYRITILTELPRGAGLGFDSIFCLLLSTALQRLQNKISNSDLQWWETLLEDINDAESPLYTIVRYAHTLESHIKWYQYMSGAIATSVCNTPFPVVSFCEDIPHTGKKELISTYDYKCFVYPFNTLFPQAWETPHVPLDYGLIYSGRPSLSEHTSQETIQGEFSHLMNFVQETFKDSITYSSGQRKPKFHKELIKEHDKGNTTVVQSLLWYTSFEMLYTLKTLYQKWYNEDDIKKCILAVTKIRHAHNVVRRSSEYLSSLITALQQFFWSRWDLLGISYNDTNTMWGSLLFVTPVEWLRKNILNTLHHAQRDFPWTDLLYTSRIDGVEAQGLVCEQDLIQQKTSTFIDSNLLILELPDNNVIFGAYDNLVQNKDVDIVLDTIHMKIYIQWKKLTSKDLHSQIGTIEMLMTALKNIGSDVSNKQLPVSSYSKSKNDMVGKIILPLVKVIKDTIKKDIPIDCYGWMYDYFLRLKKNNIRFGIMKKAVVD
jgi:hypothetical protein